MAEAPAAANRDTADRRSTSGASRGSGAGTDREFGRGGRRRGGAGGKNAKGDKDKPEAETWIPTTKLGRLVKSGRINNIETIYNFSLPIKEYQIIDKFLPSPSVLVDEVLKIMPVQKQTPSGQRTRFKAFVVVGDRKGHVGLGVKCSKEVATAIRGGIIAAKLSIIPVRLGYWGNKIGAPHTVPTKVTGKCGSVRVRLVPAPRGSGIVAAGTPHKLLEFAGVDDVFTKCQGHTKTLGNFAIATFHAIQKTFEYQTPDMWKQDAYRQDPYHQFSRELIDLAYEGKREEGKRGGRGDREDREERGSRGGRGFGGDRDFREGRFGDRGRREGGFGGRREGGAGGEEGQQQQGEGAEGQTAGQEGGERREGGRGFGGDRPRRDYGDRPRRDFGDRDRERGDREGGFGGGRRDRDDRSDRSEGGRGFGRREGGGFGGDRPRRDFGDRPRRDFGGDRSDRGDRGEGGFGRREGGGDSSSGSQAGPQ